jgi:hypothetical protein
MSLRRILIKNGKGIGSKRKNYQSIPYSSIQAFGVDTAGHFDGDVCVRVWSKGIPHVQIDFAAANVDIYQIQAFLNAKVFASSNIAAQQVDQINKINATPPNMDKKQTTAGNIIDWFGDNAKQVEPEEVEQVFKTTMPMLLDDEKVKLAFRSGRDFTIFTDRRLLRVDVQGLGKKVVFQTLLWSSVHIFSVQTAGAFLDRDMELYLHTNIMDGGLACLTQDFRRGKSNIFAIQKHLWFQQL